MPSFQPRHRDPPPRWQKAGGFLFMSGSRNQRYSIQNSSVGIGLSGKPKESILVALDLETGNFVIQQGYIYPSLTATEPHLMADERVRFFGVVPPEIGIKFATNFAVSQVSPSIATQQMRQNRCGCNLWPKVCCKYGSSVVFRQYRFLGWITAGDSPVPIPETARRRRSGRVW